MAKRNTKKVDGRTLMQVGSRWIDVTGFNSKQMDDIYNQSHGGKGSKASQEYADKLRGKPAPKPKAPGPSNVADGLGSSDPRVKANFGDENSVVDAQTQANKNAAGDSNESQNAQIVTDISGNTQEVKFDPKTGRAIVTTKAGGLVDALQGGEQESIARERARLGLSAYGTGDVSADRKRVEAGLVSRYDEIYAPQFQQEKTDLDNQLINRGFVPGSTAYNKQMFELDRRQKDAKSQYVSQALDKGASELQNLTNIDNSQRTQSVNEATAQGQQLKNLMPDFQPYKGSNVEAPNITGVYGVKEGGEVSTANNKASIAAAEKARQEAAALENAQRQGENQGSPGAGQRAGEGLGGFASNQSTVANLGTQVSLPSSFLTGAAPTQSATVPAAGTQATLPGATLNTTPAVNSNLPATGTMPGSVASTTPAPMSNAPTAGTMPGSSLTPQINPSTPSIGTTAQANTKPVKNLISKRTVTTAPNRSTITARGKYNPFGNKTGFLMGKNKAL